MAAKRTCKYCGDEIGAPECMRCHKTGCGSECLRCGLPFCNEECVGADAEAHAAVCGMLADATKLHDGTYVGIEISTQNKERMWKRPLTPEMFGEEMVGNLIPVKATLQRILDYGTQHKPPFEIKMYAGHIGEVGTGTKFFSWVSSKIAAAHVGIHDEKVAVYLISSEGKLGDFEKNWNKGSARELAKRYETAIKWLHDHQKVMKKLIENEGKKLKKKS